MAPGSYPSSSAFDQPDMFIGPRTQFILPPEPCDIRDRFEDMYRILEKGENVSGEDLNPIFIEEESRDLTMIETILTQFENFFCKFPFRASAQGRVPAGAAEKIIEKIKDLFTDRKIKCIEIDT